MNRVRLLVVLVAFAMAALSCASANAFFHAWTFSEFFSSADGDVQFIEMVASLSTETQASGAQIRTDSGNVFSFPGNLVGNTLNKRLLIATAGFSSLPGSVVPDFTLPTTDFFNPAGDRIRLFHPSLNEFHTRTFSSVPTNGVLSLHYPPAAGTQLTNSPTNFSGTTGSVNLSTPSPTGDYNGNGTIDAADYVLWRDTEGQSVAIGTAADGNANGTIDTADYDFWRARFGNAIAASGSGAATIGAVPEPSLIILMLSGLLFIACLPPRLARHGFKP